MPFRTLPAIFVGLAAAIAPLRALDYWSFNTQTPNPDIGHASLSATWVDVGPATLNYEAIGSELNAQPGYEAGSSLDFVTVDASLITRRITLSALDFSGMQAIKFSYAVASTELFEAGESARASYSINGGAWSTPITLSLPVATFTVQEFDFGSALDGAINVSVRIDYRAAMALGASLRFDNVTVVPEPATAGLVVAGLFALAAASRRRK